LNKNRQNARIFRFLGFAVAICDHKKYIIFGKILGFLIEMIIIKAASKDSPHIS